jgi:PTH1 family peptidyl-tRNA hydrolase
MNNSGNSVQAIANYFKVEPKDIIVIHDELDLPFGNYKVQTDKSSAGHNGVESIIKSLGSQEFTRIRVGVAKDDKDKQGEGANFVLNNFGFMEKLKLGSLKDKILGEIKTLIK